MGLQELLDLIASLDGMDADERAAATNDIVAAVAGLDADGVAAVSAALAEAADELLDDGADNLDDDEIATLGILADGLDAARQREAELDQAAEDRAAAAAELVGRIRGGSDPDDDGDPAEADTGDDSVDEAEPVEAEAEPEPVAAAARRRVSRVAARGIAPQPPTPVRPDFAAYGLVASASGNGIQAGQPIRDAEQLGALLVGAWQASRGARIDGQVRLPVARVGGEPSALYGQDSNGTHRYLGRDPVTNWRAMWATNSPSAVGVHPETGQPALIAAGGICAPIEPSYELRTVGSAARPVRDALVRFGADRGGIRTMPGPVITDLDGAMGVWTEANDQNPTSPTEKPCLTIDCPEEDETLIEALTFCLQSGNFRSRFFPEQLEAWLALRDVARARQAENRLLAAIEAGSTQVTAGPTVGAAKDVPTFLEKLADGYRWRMRSPEHPMRLIAPRWLRSVMRMDVARELASGTVDERLVVADGQIDSWFSSRGIRPTWHLDGDAFAAQAAGAINDYPDVDAVGDGLQVDLLMYPEGAWSWLDGGQLDLGIIRDSTLVATNDFQMFTESFEGVHFFGAPYESWTARLTVCANGATGAAVAVTDCQ